MFISNSARVSAVLALFVFSLLGACSGKMPDLPERADIIWIGYQGFLGDNFHQTNSDAIALKKGKLLFIGSRAGAEKYKGPETKIIRYRNSSPLTHVQTARLDMLPPKIETDSLSQYIQAAEKK